MFLIIPWSLNFIEIVFKIKILPSQKTHRRCYIVRLVTASWEEQSFLRYKKKSCTLCGQTAEPLNVKPDGTYSYFSALQDSLREGWIFVVSKLIPCRILCSAFIIRWFLCQTCLYRLVLSVNLCDSFNLLATDFFFQILAHPVFKMWVIQIPNKVALRNKRHFEEKKWRLYSMFKIFSTDICWMNIKWGI